MKAGLGQTGGQAKWRRGYAVPAARGRLHRIYAPENPALSLDFILVHNLYRPCENADFDALGAAGVLLGMVKAPWGASARSPKSSGWQGRAPRQPLQWVSKTPTAGWSGP
jgi:hypothetical protein